MGKFRNVEMSDREERALDVFRNEATSGARAVAEVLEEYPHELQDVILELVPIEMALRYQACRERLDRDAAQQARDLMEAPEDEQ